ncbi:MAG: hypothetical protein IPK03_13520 [Bacteroidetes bacterium]|nr:hypothetical protein [Bacteroidota bacterium]
MFNKICAVFLLSFFYFETHSQELKFEWNKIIGQYGNSNGISIQSDKEGYIYASGTFMGIININGNILSSETGNDGYLFKLDTTGNLIWYKQFKGTSNISVNSIAIDSNNDVIITGTYQASVKFDIEIKTNNTDLIRSTNAFIAKYNSNGNLIWAKNTGGIAQSFKAVIDQNNDILLTGMSIDIHLFDTSISVSTLDSVKKYQPKSGTPYWEY